MIQLAKETKAELEARARARGITTDGATAGELRSRLDQGDLDKSADGATDGHHKASVIEDVPDDEKAGKESVQQREIPPAERDLPPGTSALQTAPTE